MKLTIWIRADADGKNPVVRTDAKYETYDTPFVCYVGNRILDALEKCAGKGKKPEGAEQKGKKE